MTVATHNTVRTYWSKKLSRPLNDVDLTNVPGRATTDSLEEEDLAVWRNAVLDLAWKALEEYERDPRRQRGLDGAALRADFPDDDMEQLAARLSEKTGKPFQAAALRQQLRRARLRFAETLLEEVAAAWTTPRRSASRRSCASRAFSLRERFSTSRLADERHVAGMRVRRPLRGRLTGRPRSVRPTS